MMDAEVPVNYLAQLSGHKNLKSLDSYKTASHKMYQQRKPAKQSLGVRAIQKARKGLSGIFISSNIRSIEGCKFEFYILQQCNLQQWRKHPSVKAAKNATLLFQIKLKFPHDS